MIDIIVGIMVGLPFGLLAAFCAYMAWRGFTGRLLK